MPGHTLGVYTYIELVQGMMKALLGKNNNFKEEMFKDKTCAVAAMSCGCCGDNSHPFFFNPGFNLEANTYYDSMCTEACMPTPRVS